MGISTEIHKIMANSLNNISADISLRYEEIDVSSFKYILEWPWLRMAAALHHINTYHGRFRDGSHGQFGEDL